MDLPPLPPDPTVSVVIPARDAAATLPAAVDSALAQDVPADLEVVVAVAPTGDATRDVAADLARRDPRVRVVDNPAMTAPSGLNAAIGASRGAVIARLDAHAALPPGYLTRAVALLRETGAANVGGVQRPVAADGFAAAVAAAMASPYGAGGARYRVGGEPGPVDTVYLGVFHRHALDAVGGFDERLVRNQDFELNHRLHAAGGLVWFHPDLVVDYRPRGTLAGLWRQYHDYGAWKRLVLKMHPGSLRPRQLAPPLLVVGLLATGTLAAFGTVWPFGALAGTYLAATVTAGILAAPRRALVPATALALAVMHLAWGTGFLVGRRRAEGRRAATTRAGRGTP